MLLISEWYILPAAFLLDFLLGDPLWLPHPVRWMGKAIEKFQPIFRQKYENKKTAGFLFALTLIVATWFIGSLLLTAARVFDPFLGKTIEIMMIYYTISAFSLKTAAMAVYNALITEGLEAARKKLSHIVGRDTERLDKDAVVRAGVETVAENLVDGVIAPLFWAAVGGAPLAMAYKMINTLDSMVGYKNEEFMDFGMVSARTDDVANFVPARLSVPIIAVSAFFLKISWKRALDTGFKEGRNHTSPNAGYPEAAFAGALGVRLGGPNFYENVRVEKPWIGASFGPVEQEDLKKACRLMLVSSAFGVFMAMALAHVMSLF